VVVDDVNIISKFGKDCINTLMMNVRRLTKADASDVRGIELKTNLFKAGACSEQNVFRKTDAPFCFVKT
jgi:hypothetical protein